MNRQLTDQAIRGTCRELLDQDLYAGSRELTRVLRGRFGAVGKTQRVLAIWRQERAERQRHRQFEPAQAPVASSAPGPKNLEAEQAEIAALRERAERAELREVSHQDRWFLEIDRLRQELRAQPAYAAETRKLQERVTQLIVENSTLRDQIRRLISAPESP